jgi:hypothetical protein
MSSLKRRLVTENSELRKLKFGSDKLHQGSSKQPFIREPLPGVLEDNPNLGLLGGNTDFILRAGTLKRSEDDVSRLSTFLLDTTQGNAFITKQNLLSRTNVRSVGKPLFNQGIYLPTSTLAQVGVAGVGGHLLKQGINPFKDTQAGGESSDPNLFTKVKNLVSGITDTTGLPLYLSHLKEVKNSHTNRLVNLKDEKIGKSPTSLQLGKSKNFITSTPNTLISYDGGPGSALGVGKTIINRVTYSDEGLDFSKNPNLKEYNIASYSYDQLASEKRSEFDNKIREDFRKNLTKKPNSVISDSLSYTKRNIESRVNLGNPGEKGNRKNYVKGKEVSGKVVIVDKINAMQIYQSNTHTQNEIKNDLCDFRISIIDPNGAEIGESFAKTYLHFRAFIDSFQDNMDAQWEGEKYMGRGENFYRYNGFDRTIQMAFTTAAQSKGELMPMYQKLNYLQSAMTPNYTKSGYYFGNLVKMRVGGYLYEVPGIISSLSYTVPESAPWEIAISNEETTEETTDGNTSTDSSPSFTDKTTQVMPHIMNVSLTFKPIHRFAPRLQQNTYGNNTVVESFGNEQFISLGRGEGITYTGYSNVTGINPQTGEKIKNKNLTVNE